MNRSELQSRLRRDADDVLALGDRLVSGEPWTLAPELAHGEGDWGVREVLAHLVEMIPYWTDEAGRILAGPAEPAPFGRVATDAYRLAVIERERTLPASVLLARIADEVEVSLRRVERMSEADLARRGLHPKRGPMSVAEILERFVADHLAEHAAQLRDILAGTPPES